MLEEYVSHRGKFEPGFRLRNPHLLSSRQSASEVETFVETSATAPQTILDVGCGTGSETPYRGRAQVHVYDVGNAPMADGATRVASPAGLYDLVVLAHVLEHVPDPRGLLEDSYRHVKQEGLIYLEIPREAALYGERPRLPRVTAERKEWHEHINYFDEDSLAALVRSTGGVPQATEVGYWDGGELVRMTALLPT